MRGEEMLEAVGYIDTDLIKKGEKTMKKFRWRRWTAAAACAALICGGVLVYRRSLPQYAEEMLSVSDFAVGGMGSEIYWAYSVDELRRDNPTDGEEIRALPAYRNTVSWDERERPFGQDLEAMEEYLLSLAEKFGLDVDSLEIQNNAPDEGEMMGLTMEFASRGLEAPEYYSLPYRLWVKTEELKIEVDANMTATITFTDGIPVPEEYRLDYDSTPEELLAVSSYLWERYGEQIGYENPQVYIHGGDYTTEGEQLYTLCFYDGSDDEIENFENYSFNHAEFSPRLIRIYNDAALEEIGLYPLIDEEEALRLLTSGEYYTSVADPDEIPDEAAAVRCELVYRSGSKDKVLIPFYRFYVYLENAAGSHLHPEGMKAYGAYYVPAVDPAYLEKTIECDG